MSAYYPQAVGRKSIANGVPKLTTKARPRRPRVAQNLALTHNSQLAIMPFDEKYNLPSLIADYWQNPQLAIDLILHTRP